MTSEERLSRLEGVYEHLASKADMAELRLDIQKDMAELRAEFERSKAETNSRFDGVEDRFDGVEGRLDRIENRLDKLIFALFGAGLAFGVGMAVLIVRSFAAG